MALISLRQLLDHAAEHGYGVPAYNVNNMEQMHSIMQAADETDSPVSLRLPSTVSSYAVARARASVAPVLEFLERVPDVPVPREDVALALRLADHIDGVLQT